MKRLLTAALLATVMLATSPPAAAIGFIRVQAAAVQSNGATLQQMDARLSIHSARRSTLTLHTGRIRLPSGFESQTGTLQGVSLTCVDPVVREPLLACPQLSVQLRTEKLSTLNVKAQVRYEMNSGKLAASGTGPEVAGATPTFKLDYAPQGWKAEAALPPMPVSAWRSFIKPWVTLPDSLTLSGETTLGLHIEGGPKDTSATVDFALRDGAFQNADFTWLGEKLAISAQAKAELTSQPLRFESKVSGTQGQALAGPVVLDFSTNPLSLAARGTFRAQLLAIETFESQQKELANASGSARVALAPFSLIAAEASVRDIRFPAAYSTYLQQSLATTPFNQLKTTGSASATVRIADNQPVAFTLSVKDLDFSDESRALEVTGVQTELNWAAGTAAAQKPSFLAWNSSRGWGVTGARTRMDFAVHDRDFRLLQPARLPVFDGALRINTFAVRHMGEPDMAGDFDALIEPISMGPIARALGWPEFGGSLAGRIPGLTYANRELRLQGDIEAQVFDGRVVARNLRVRDPLGNLPRLYADIAARNLDLELVTRTFEFGSITGRLDVDLAGLETVGLSPVAFDLTIATPPGDKSRHRISQRAVQSLSNIGGGGGGVTAALQSGALRFFDEFGYARLGLNCRLRNDVCQMSGAGPAGTGFYIVQGAGLPRIDIIGNNQRVAWLTFISQAANALENPGEINVR
jgi:hypothetical protein